jgi:glycosyltransferase involved in cell wall biosynthesis
VLGRDGSKTRPHTSEDIPTPRRKRYALGVTLSVVIITHNEEANIGRTLESVRQLVCDGKGEIIVVDSGSTDRTVDIAQTFGAKVFVEEWKGYAAQKNSAIDKASGDWILSLDADEALGPGLAGEIFSAMHGRLSPVDRLPKDDSLATVEAVMAYEEAFNVEIAEGVPSGITAAWIPRQNYFLARWIRHGGYWPDKKLRLFKRGAAAFQNRLVHEDARLSSDAATTAELTHALIHHSYPTLSDYIDHMNRYSSLGAEMAVAKGQGRFSILNIVVRPWATFVYNYFFRLGFLDGQEGLLLHLYHAVYVSWKYAKAWELGKAKREGARAQKL